MKLIFHIGRHKTGTSAIQTWLFSNYELLAGIGILYPRCLLDASNLHHGFAQALDTRLADANDFSVVEAYAASLRAEVEEKKCTTVLISSEYFQEFNCLELVERFVAEVGADSVEIICYLREHVDYALTAFKQVVQEGADPIPALATVADFFTLEYLSFMLDLWAGVGQLRLLLFHRDFFFGKNLIADFARNLSIGDDAGIPLVFNSIVNPSLNGNLLVYVMACRLTGIPLAYEKIESLIQASPSLNRPYYLDPFAVEKLRMQSDWNSFLKSKFGPFVVTTWSKYPKLDLDILVESLPDFVLPMEVAPALWDGLRASLVEAIAYCTL